MLFQTVTAVNYLPMALVTARSLKTYVPHARLCILISDAAPTTLQNIRTSFGDLAEFIGCDALEYPHLSEMRQYYSALEFNSACKILVMDYQLRVRCEEECQFIDPDMLVLQDFTPLTKRLKKDIVVTYHAHAPFPEDGEWPSELELVTSGAINGGFIYVRHSERSLEALAWLAEKTRHGWFIAPNYGMFGDQQWLGFLPQFFDDVTGILRYPGVNVAYWNLHERPLREEGGRLMAGDSPALLFHFSGFGETKLTRHSNRRFDAATEQCCEFLVRHYQQLLESERVLVAKAGIASDYPFNSQSLQRRLKRAEQLCAHYFSPQAHAGGRFSRLGHFIDRLVG